MLGHTAVWLIVGMFTVQPSPSGDNPLMTRRARSARDSDTSGRERLLLRQFVQPMADVAQPALTHQFAPDGFGPLDRRADGGDRT